MMLIKLFGPTSVVTDAGGVPISDLGGVKPRQILEILAASPGAPVTKDRLADLLWDGEPPKSYIGTLESYVCVLRRKLGLSPGKKSPLATTSNGYLLDPVAAVVDLAEFRRFAGLAAKARPAEGLRLAHKAMALVTGELLANETFAGWACSERKVFKREVVQVCGRAASDAIAIHDYEAAVDMARLGIGYDPLAEDVWQHLMRALAACGRGSEAIRAYFDLRTATVNELGMEPGPTSRALYMDILCDGPAQALNHIGGAGGAVLEDADLSRRLHRLRQALEAITGVQAPTMAAPLAEMAGRVLATASR
jgi:DNA-binding SARP family transcriptional activator